ncbi:MAG TPA: Calx-beta domain-containing protein, partial [Methanocella sp.]
MTDISKGINKIKRAIVLLLVLSTIFSYFTPVVFAQSAPGGATGHVYVNGVAMGGITISGPSGSSTTTRDDGSFQIEVMYSWSPNGVLSLTYNGNPYTSSTLDFSAFPDYTFNIPISSSLSGAITYKGSPVAGITVSADGHSTTTDASSLFSISGLTSGVSGMTVTVSKDTGAQGTFTVNTPGVGGAALWAGSYNLVPATVTVSGVVTYNSAAITSAVTVTATGGLSVTSDSSGHYSIPGVPGDSSITLTTSYLGIPGSAAITTMANGAGSTANIDITTAATTISGTISYQGSLKGGVTVSASGHSATTAADGTYTLGGLPSGVSGTTVTVSYDSGHGATSGTFTVDTPTSGGLVSGRNYNLVPSTVTVSGAVTYNGGTLPGPATVTVRGTGISTTTTNTFSLSGVAGDTSITIDASYSDFSGSATLTTRADGAATTGVSINIAASSISGKIYYKGTPVSGATVRVMDGSNQLGSTATSGADGSYSIGGLPYGRIVSVQASYVPSPSIGTVSGSNSQTTPASGTLTGVNINLVPPTVTVSGSATYNGAGISGITITATSGSTIYPTVTTGSGGSFTMSGLPGDASVSFTASRNGQSSSAASISTRADGTGSTLSGALAITSPASVATFSMDRTSVNEGGSATVTVHRTSDNPATFTVQLKITASSDTMKVNNVAYTGPVTLTFNAGVQDQSVTITAPTDAGIHQGDRDITISLQNPASPGTLGTPASATLTIRDADAPPTIAFTVSGSSISNTGGDVTITVARYGASGNAASAQVAVTGSAIVGTDYTTSQAMPWTVSFAAGENEKTVTVHVNSITGNKNIMFTLGSITGATAGDNQQYTLNIQTAGVDTGSSGTSSFQFEQTSGFATSGQVTLNVIRSGATAGSSSVQVWVSGASTAMTDVDYTPSQAMPATLNFGAGDTTRSVVFNIIGNHSGMAATKLVMMLASATGSATLGTNSIYTLNIGGSSGANVTTATPTPTPSGTDFGNGTVRNLRTNMTYERIQWGIDNATSGDTLEVGATTYYESIVINKALTIRAAGGQPVIDGQGAGRVVDIAADGVVLEGFVIRGSATGGYGIYGHGSGITVSNCQVTANGYGIFFDDASNAAIQSCNVGQNTYGITFDDTTNSKISGCTVSSNANYG